MGLRDRLNSVDARLGLAPGEQQSWLAFLAGKNSRRPILAALHEADARILALEASVAALEARNQ
jgi:hypothetical protein